MNEELGQIDADLKGLFMEDKPEEMYGLLKEQADGNVKEITEYNWSIIKKYYETKRFELLFRHFKFVAYTCFLAEYAHRMELISEDAFATMMEVYYDLYEQKKQEN
jgi:hypothetical protein